MNKYRRTDEEVGAALVEQRDFLRRSCEAYDAGILAEAKRIATAIYIICHDGSGTNTRSLLRQLKLKDGLKFISTAKSLEDGAVPRTALAGAMYLGGGMAFVPWFLCVNDEKPVRREVAFSRWWEETVFETVRQREIIPNGATPYIADKTLSRKNIVFFMRSQDNGSHFDRELRDEAYSAMAKWRTGFEYELGETGVFNRVPNPHLATVRQIAWELEQTLVSIPGGPTLPPPEAAAEWLKAPPSQYLLDSGMHSIRMRIAPDLVPQGRVVPYGPLHPKADQDKP